VNFGSIKRLAERNNFFPGWSYANGIPVNVVVTIWSQTAHYAEGETVGT
jgi:hypothetical protein